MPSYEPPILAENLQAESDDPESQGPLVLGVATREYLLKVRDAIAEGNFGDGDPRQKEVFNDRANHILRAATFLEEQVDQEIGRPGLIIQGANTGLINLVNNGTEIPESEEKFTDVVLRYFEELPDPYHNVISGVREGGPKYWMDGMKGYREEAAVDLEELLERLRDAKEISQHELAPRSYEYRLLEHSLPKRRSSAPPPVEEPRIDLGTRERHRIIETHRNLIKRLGDTELDDVSKISVLMVTNDILHHLSDNIGGPGLSVIGKLGKRPLNHMPDERKRALDHMPDGPLEQLEVMIAITNAAFRDYQNIVVVQRDLLGGTDWDMEEAIELTKRKSDAGSA